MHPPCFSAASVHVIARAQSRTSPTWSLPQRLLHALRASALAALAMLGAAPANAIGPEAPVDFLDVYLARGYMLLVIEPEQIVELQVMRIVHQDGEPRVREEVDWTAMRMFDYTAPITGPDDFQYREPRERGKPERDRKPPARELPAIDSARPRPDLRLARSDAPAVASDALPRRVGILIPLESAAMRELTDGAYAEKFVARARLPGQAAGVKQLTMVRWSHFVMRGGKPSFIGQDEYSRLVDPPSDGVDGSGGKIQLNLGRGIQADVAVEKTEKNRAVPLGRLGGVVPEREESRKESARDETRER